MKNSDKKFRNLSLVTGVLSTIFLTYTVPALLFFKRQVFIEKEIISIADISIFFGFALFALFNIVSLFWLSQKFDKIKKMKKQEKMIFALGIFSFFLLLGDKIMADEIGQELPMGWKTTGEWTILFIFIAIQLFYNIIFLKILKNK